MKPIHAQIRYPLPGGRSTPKNNDPIYKVPK
jgi:hypothetical protein